MDEAEPESLAEGGVSAEPSFETSESGTPVVPFGGDGAHGAGICA